nr:extracellular solute-binding protein [Micromonospora sp. DSM 115978]
MTSTTGPPTIGRRGLLTGTLAAVAGLGLGGCTSADRVLADRTVLRQWNLFGGGDGARMIEMHDLFRSEHPDIDLRATTYTWGSPFYTKLAMGAAGGRGSDVATVHLSRLESLAPGRLLDPFDVDALADAGLSATDFLPDIWRRCFVDGQLYAIPMDTHVLVNHYNREICRQAGVLDGDGRLIETHGVEEYFAMLAEVKAVTGTYGTSLDTNAGWRQFWAMYRQQDGELVFGEDDFELDDAKALAALDVMHRISGQGLAPRNSDGAATSANLVNGLAGLVQVGNWEIPVYQSAGLDFGVTQFPDLFGNHRTQGDSHAYVLPHQRDPDPRLRAATNGYVSWMLRTGLIWAGGGHIPAYLPVADSAEYQNMQPQAGYREAAQNVQFDPEIWFSGSAARMQDVAAAVFQGLYAGTTTPEGALASFKDLVRTLLRVPDPT